MDVLKELVKMGYTVVATFHNLSNDVLKDLGSIYLLCKGRMAYSGNVADVCNYFAASTYQVFFSVSRTIFDVSHFMKYNNRY
jgi:ABC-type multidrug transport system ATPase subunit